MKKRAGFIVFCFIQTVFFVLAGCEALTGGSPATVADIGSVSLGGLTAPVAGAAPVTAGALSPGASTYSAQSLDWSPPVSGTFAVDTSYTATIVLKAAAGYRFAGTIAPGTGGVGTPSEGTINGGAAENTLSFTVSFPATTADISSVSLGGLTAPVAGAAPVTAGALSPGASTYSAQSLDWSPPVSGTFAVDTSYTAAIVLKAAAGYRFAGTIAPDTGGVGTPSEGTINGGATENTLSFTVDFPATTADINSVFIGGLAAPVAGETPVTVGALSPGASTYSAQSLDWFPGVSGTFKNSTSYTAAIVLKAGAGYKFTGTIVPGTGGAGTPSAGIISGDTMGNTMSFTVTFPATAAAVPEPSVVGAWSGIYIGFPMTYTFKDDGTLEAAQLFNGDDPYISTYTYDSATNRIYETLGDPPELYGTYSFSGDKLSITRTYSEPYTRQDSGSGLAGIWRLTIADNYYHEYEFKQDETLLFRNMRFGVVDEVEFSYTASGNELSYSREFLAAQLSGDTLLYVADEPISFTRQGSGSGFEGTWTASYNEITITLEITATEFTGPSRAYPCCIDGNYLYVTDYQEFTYNIDTDANPPVLILSYEASETYDRVD